MRKNILKDLLRNVIDSSIALEARLHSKIQSDKKQILILRKDGLGDCLLFYPFLKDYRRYYKDAKITLVFPSYFKDLSPALSDIDEVLWFDHKRFSKSFSYRRSFLIGLKHAGFDTAIYPVFTREPIGDLMMKITEAPEIIGFDTGARDTYTKLIKIPDEIKSEIERNALFAKEITGTKSEISFPTIDSEKLQKDKANTLLSSISKPYAVIFPGAGASYRIWPHDRFSAVIEHLMQKGIQPVLCGSHNEYSLTKNIISMLRDGDRNNVIDLTGQTDLATLAHILSGAQLYFGSDTGIMHLAAAVGTPVIGIIGSGSIGRFFPYGDPKKNIALHNRAFKPTWDWSSEKLSGYQIHPSIESITLEMATGAIDSMIKWVGAQSTLRRHDFAKSNEKTD